MLPEGIPHMLVVSHNLFLNELYEGIWRWNKDRVDSRVKWDNAAGERRTLLRKGDTYPDARSRHVLCYDAETKNLDYINMVSPKHVHE
jgi:hypothetical protein